MEETNSKFEIRNSKFARPELVIIAAVAEENRVIGKEQDLPWHLPEDLKRFKRLTLGHPILMGSHTFESLVHQFGGPLKNRRNVVLTSRPEAYAGYEGVETYTSIDAALEALDGEERIFIGGGAGVYQQFLPLADRMELTLVEGHYEGDTYFPPFEHLVGTTYEITEVDTRDGFRFVSYARKR